MGGNAIKNAIRLNRDDYFRVEAEIRAKLVAYCPNITFAVIEAYATKESFGDMDIIVTDSTGNNQDILQRILKTFEHPEHVINGGVLSLNYNGFQIDFIKQTLDNFDFARKYFSFNDLGNLIGRVAHKMGFKFGHDGVWYVVRDGDYVVGECCLTKDFDKALAFFGFNVARYYKGFNTLEDIFKYVSSSLYFNRDLYPLEHRNHIARMRDRKRKTYTAFLKYCDEMEWDLDYVFYGEYIYLHKAFDAFPIFLVDYRFLEDKLAQKRIIKSKFNGEIVKTITGFTDKALGQFIQQFKQWVTDGNINNFEEYVLKSDAENIKTDITHCLYSSRCYKNG